MLLFAAPDDGLGLGLMATILGGIIAFLWGVHTYAESQKWKRLEFVAKEMKAYESDRVVQVVFQMLDWGARVLPLLDERPHGAPGGEEETDEEMNEADKTAAAPGSAQNRRPGKWVRVTKLMVIGALEHNSVREKKPNSKYTQEEVRIRDHFDRFFDHWNRFGHYIQTGLVEYDDCHPYLAYWLRVIYGPDSHRDADFREAVQGYIAGYYSGTGVDVLVREYRART